jgi:hypothetical protein
MNTPHAQQCYHRFHAHSAVCPSVFTYEEVSVVLVAVGVHEQALALHLARHPGAFVDGAVGIVVRAFALCRVLMGDASEPVSTGQQRRVTSRKSSVQNTET